MSPITIVLIATVILGLIVGAAFWHYALWPSVLENRNMNEVLDDDDEIPDQDELDDDDDDDDDDDEYDDDDDDEYDDDDDEGYVDNDRPILRVNGETIAELAVDVPRDYIREGAMARAMFRDKHPEYFLSVKEYRDFWRAEASSYKIAVDLDRARWRKENGIAA